MLFISLSQWHFTVTERLVCACDLLVALLCAEQGVPTTQDVLTK